jgi:spoIIIJ-associated protein
MDTTNETSSVKKEKASNGMERNAIQSLVEEILRALGASVDALTISDGPRTVVSVSSKDSAMLIGPKGEHLRALNHLARRIAEARAKDESVSFIVDIDGHLENELEKIRGNARMLAQRARLFKHEVELDPMTAYERLVIHELFSEDPEIQTESRGEGKFRHIVLKYIENSKTI